MAIMAPAAPEQALMGLIRSCSTDPVFVASETRNSAFGSSGSGSSGAFHHHHHLDWQTLQTTPNSQSHVATSLDSPAPATDWENLLNHPGGGYDLPIWSSKAAEDHESLLQDPLATDVDDARNPALQPQLLEAVEGTRATVTMDALVDGAAAAPHENRPGATAVEASPPQSPHRHGVDLPATSSRKRKKDRPSPDLKSGEQEVVNSKTGKRGSRGRERSSSETSGESGGAGRESHHHRRHPRDHHRDSKPEFSKQDYIHVRARRGQATDSHSLAERVRREKMSERMKFLQDLVPGCRKVTGKAVMLDEIINYVQSLQRQVESLSMKLASVSPAQSSHWTLESLLSNKEILQAQQFSSHGAAAGAAGPFAMQQQQQQQRMPPPPPLPAPAAAVAAAAAQRQLPFGFDFRGSLFGGLEPRSRSLGTLGTFEDLARFTPVDPSLLLDRMGSFRASCT